MIATILVSGAYLAQLGLKTWLAVRLRRRSQPADSRSLHELTILQAVLSGDPGLEDKLAANLAAMAEARFIWVVDRDDPCAIQLGEKYAGQLRSGRLQVIEVEPPPQGNNPKLWKLAAALPRVETEFIAVVDDDTRLPRDTALQMLGSLDRGSGLATGCPTYEGANGIWCRLTAEFVNSSAALTYLPAASCCPVRTINGMGYTMRTAEARRLELFSANLHALTDDLAVARAVTAAGKRIEQCPHPMHVSTTVTSAGHYGRLMHRWFVFARLLVQSEPPLIRLAIFLSFGLPPLLLMAVLQWVWVDPVPGVAVVLALLVLRLVTLAWVSRWLSGQWRHAPFASLLTELLQPVFLAAGCLFPVIRWRHRTIRVHDWNRFEYLPT